MARLKSRALSKLSSPGDIFRKPLAQPIYADGVVVEEVCLVELFRSLRDGLQRLYPLFVTARERTYRPVASEQHPVPAEARDRMFDERPQVLRSPSLGIRVSHESGDLAGNIRKLGDLRDVRAPWIEILFFHLRHAAVIQDKNHLRAFGN